MLFRNANDPFESAAHIFLIFALGLSIAILLNIIPQLKITYTTVPTDVNKNKKYTNSNFLLSIPKTMYLIIVTACGAVVATPIKVFKLYEERLFEIFLGEIVINILFTVTAFFASFYYCW